MGVAAQKVNQNLPNSGFPKEYLKQGGLGKGQYNQVANYAYVQSEINIKIGKKAPDDYLGYVLNPGSVSNFVSALNS